MPTTFIHQPNAGLDRFVKLPYTHEPNFAWWAGIIAGPRQMVWAILLEDDSILAGPRPPGTSEDGYGCLSHRQVDRGRGFNQLLATHSLATPVVATLLFHREGADPGSEDLLGWIMDGRHHLNGISWGHIDPVSDRRGGELCDRGGIDAGRPTLEQLNTLHDAIAATMGL